MKKILIIGDNSYIGIHFYEWIKKYPEKYYAEIVSSRNYKWMKKNFNNYDTVVNFAGIVHISNPTEDLKP
ncbi:MAG: NAD-dependent epimerase, partial [Firmicutes bacterium]|nr:NAD-dependent epimerase [Bacillota bacterium]